MLPARGPESLDWLDGKVNSYGGSNGKTRRKEMCIYIYIFINIYFGSDFSFFFCDFSFCFLLLSNYSYNYYLRLISFILLFAIMT